MEASAADDGSERCARGNPEPAAPARIAVVGCGWWSTEAHLPALSANPDAEIAVLVDPDRKRRAAAVERFRPRCEFDSIEQALAETEIDGAICCVPHSLHHPLAAKLLDAGIPTLVEKPLTIDPLDARDLVERARQAGVELLVGYPWHYNPQATELRTAIASGRIGELELVQCLFASTVRQLYGGRPEDYRDVFGYSVTAPGHSTYSDPALSGGGQGQTQVTHAAALLLWMTGLRPAAVTAWTAEMGLQVDLVDSVAVTFESGAIGSIASTGGLWPGHEEMLEYRIFGNAGHVVFDVNRGFAAIHDAAGVEELAVLSPERRYPAAAPSGNLVQLVLGRGENVSPGEIGCETVEMVDAMYRSGRKRRAIYLRD